MFVTFNLHFKISINKLELIQSTGFFLKAKQWITADIKVWINTALLTFLITEHVYSYNNIFSTIYLRTRNLRCVPPLFSFLR